MCVCVCVQACRILTLDISNNPIGDAGAERICRALQKCRYFRFLNMSNVGLTKCYRAAALSKLIATSTSLQTLFLGSLNTQNPSPIDLFHNVSPVSLKATANCRVGGQTTVEIETMETGTERLK